MGCPKCGRGWRRVEGNTLICLCGYRETVEKPRVTLPAKKPPSKPYQTA